MFPFCARQGENPHRWPATPQHTALPSPLLFLSPCVYAPGHSNLKPMLIDGGSAGNHSVDCDLWRRCYLSGTMVGYKFGGNASMQRPQLTDYVTLERGKRRWKDAVTALKEVYWYDFRPEKKETDTGHFYAPDRSIDTSRNLIPPAACAANDIAMWRSDNTLKPHRFRDTPRSAMNFFYHHGSRDARCRGLC